MDHAAHNRIASFIWSIADGCLRDVFGRGTYRDVILPMFVLRWNQHIELDALSAWGAWGSGRSISAGVKGGIGQ